MEFLIVITALCLLGILANRFGYDSRSRLHSWEEQAAAAGLAWDAPDRP
jgi:hypothetical protein